MSFESLEITSARLSSPRTIWVPASPAVAAQTCLIFLDGELYRNRVHAPETVDELQVAGAIPPVNSIYVSSRSAADRHADYVCDERYAEFLGAELVPWIEKNVQLHDRHVLCGLSLSGLAAAYTALRYPRTVCSALCQSPSAWWNREWLAQHMMSLTTEPVRIWLSVGRDELQQDVSHPPSGLYQGVNQLDSCQRLQVALQEAGHRVHYSEFAGGHDPRCWQAELPAALQWLLKAAD